MARKLGRIALAVCFTASAAGLGAQTESRTWSMCSAGALRACNSIMLTTTPYIVGGTRMGTFLTLAFQNLQGFEPLDNSDARTIWEFSIAGNYIGGPTDASDPATPSAILTGGATGGPPNGVRDVLGFEVFAPGPFASLYDQDEFVGVQGCDPDPTRLASVPGTGGRPGYFTCGPDAWVSFPIFNPIPPWIDADQMTTAMIGGTGIDGAFSMECSGNSPQCVVTSSATPEPATMILVGSGLFSLAAGGARRRRKRNAAEA